MSTYEFLSGGILFAAWTAGVFFLRFWTRTRDQLFLLFGIACGILGAERIVIHVMGDPRSEDSAPIYLMRLCAFLLILFAVWNTNRRDRGGKG